MKFEDVDIVALENKLRTLIRLILSPVAGVLFGEAKL